MTPSDTWAFKGVHCQQHPTIDLDNYLDAIETLHVQLKPKVDAIREWIDNSNTVNLRTRSEAFIMRASTKNGAFPLKEEWKKGEPWRKRKKAA